MHNNNSHEADISQLLSSFVNLVKRETVESEGIDSTVLSDILLEGLLCLKLFSIFTFIVSIAVPVKK